MKADLPKQMVSTNLIEDCDKLVNDAREKAFDNIAMVSRISTDLSKGTECIIPKLKTLKWFDQIVKLVVFEGAENLTENERNRNVLSADEAADKLYDEAVDDCKNEEEVGKIFDFFHRLNDSINEKDDVADINCIRNYVTEKNLTDINVFSLESNPKSTNISKEDCKSIVSKLEKEFYVSVEKSLSGVVEDHQINSQLEKYRESDLFDKILVVASLKQFNINEDQKLTERERFIQSLKDLAIPFSSCAEDFFKFVCISFASLLISVLRV